MMVGRPVLRYFSEAELRANPSPAPSTAATPLLTTDMMQDLLEVAGRFGDSGEVTLDSKRCADKPHLATFLSFCHALGAVSVYRSATEMTIRPCGRLARHVPEILSLYMRDNFTIFDDWNTAHVIPEDKVSALEFVHQLELRRIHQERRIGRDATPLAERPVAFVIFRAKSSKGEDCYLFEINKDWRRLNFIGGKQEPMDSEDFAETARREVSEELGIARNRLVLTRLNDLPLIGYSLSGNVGSLARYPCVLFGAQVDGGLHTRIQDRWLTEKTIRKAISRADNPIMVNPAYLAFLLEGQPARLSRLPLSTDNEVRASPLEDFVPNGEKTVDRWLRVAKENKDLTVAVITSVAALVGIVLTVW